MISLADKAKGICRIIKILDSFLISNEKDTVFRNYDPVVIVLVNYLILELSIRRTHIIVIFRRNSELFWIGHQ